MKAVVLVGHGGLASDMPRGMVQELMALEGRRQASGGPVTEREAELDRTIRTWPRTPESDPYKTGLERVAEANPLCLDEPAPMVLFGAFSTDGVAVQFSVWAATSNYFTVLNTLPDEVQLATGAGFLPRVVNIWLVRHENALFVFGAKDSGWVKNVQEHANVKLRIGDVTYPLTASVETERAREVYQRYIERYRGGYPEITATMPSVGVFRGLS